MYVLVWNIDVYEFIIVSLVLIYIGYVEWIDVVLFCVVNGFWYFYSKVNCIKGLFVVRYCVGYVIINFLCFCV